MWFVNLEGTVATETEDFKMTQPLPPSNWSNLPEDYFTPKYGFYGMGFRQAPEKLCSFITEPIQRKVKKIFISCNPFGGGGQGAAILEEAMTVFESAGVEVVYEMTTTERRNEQIAGTLNLTDFDAFVVIGGDGSTHEAINGMLRRKDSQRIAVGVIPGGTGNSFAADLGNHTTILAAEAIVRGEIRKMDVGLVRTELSSTYFFNIVSWPAEMMILAEQLRWMGPLRYKVAVGYETVTGGFGEPVIVTIDGVTKPFSCLNMLQIQNNQHLGDKALAAPQAKCDDGLLDCLILHDMNRAQMAYALLELETGGWLYNPLIMKVRFRKLTLQCLNDPRVYNVDGELQPDRDPLSVEVIPGALEMFVGPQAVPQSTSPDLQLS